MEEGAVGGSGEAEGFEGVGAGAEVGGDDAHDLPAVGGVEAVVEPIATDWQQIAGQVHYLDRLYEAELASLGDRAVRTSYEQLCRDPAGVLSEISARSSIPVAVSPPASFPPRRYEDRDDEKARFAELLAELQEER